MNIAFKHLEAKLRFAELTIGQWAAVIGGLLFALAFALYLSPFGGVADLVIGVYLGAIPASAAFLASATEFDLCGLAAAALRHQRRPGRFLSGPGADTLGYTVTPPVVAVPHGALDGADVDPPTLWD